MELEDKKKFIVIKDKNGKKTKIPFDFETNILEEGDYIFKDKDGKWYVHKENSDYLMGLLKKDLNELEKFTKLDICDNSNIELEKVINQCKLYVQMKARINLVDTDKNGNICFVEYDTSAIETVLNHLKELEKERDVIYQDYQDLGKEYHKLQEESIPIAVVEEKIEELDKEEKDLQDSISEEEREEYSDANISFNLMDIEIRRQALQGLLKESK